MRLIDADALEYIGPDYCPTGEWIPATLIRKAPTIDAVEVVRCKDCAYWDGIYCVDFLTTDPEGYCSWAKRRKDEG